MPIDPSIYANLRPVQPIAAPNPLDTIATLGKIEDVRAQVEQRRQLAEATRQKAMDEAQIRNVMSAAGGDVEKAIPQLYAVNPRAGASFEEAVRKAQKENGAAVGENLKNQKLQLDLGLQIAGTVTDPASARLARPLLTTLAPQIAPLLPPDTETFDTAGWDRIKNAALTRQQQVEASQKSLELLSSGKPQEALSMALGAPGLTPAQKEQILQGAPALGVPQAIVQQFRDATPEQVTAFGIPAAKREELAGQAATRAQTEARDAQTAANQAALREQATHSPAYKEWQDYQAQGGTLGFDAYMTADANRKAAHIAVNTGTTPIPGDFTQTGPAFLATVPAQWRTTVQKIANYDEDPSKVTSMRSGMRETVMQWVNQVNPAYDATRFSVRGPTRQAFTTGTQGKQITNINTAIGHIDQLADVAGQLQSGGFVPGNRAWNAIRTAFGSDVVTNFDTLKDALAGEVANALSQSGATVSGIADAQAKIHGASSATQMAGYVKTLLPIMGAKLGNLDYAYHQAMGADDPYQPLSPESRRVLLKHGVDPAHFAGGGAATTSPGAGRVRVIGPNGQTGTVPADTTLPPGWRTQ